MIEVLDIDVFIRNYLDFFQTSTYHSLRAMIRIQTRKSAPNAMPKTHVDKCTNAILWKGPVGGEGGALGHKI